ncbi:hypothetical protein WA026_009575 [Henosepilachna vigintioctopunctata]|uniref:Synembryn n=1 Tax=Henosepilachna vigintioctopunctata TaxID=420089 RepID=A0AAW1TZS3_9CUCU
MDIENIKLIIGAKDDCSTDALKIFIDKSEKVFTFPNLDEIIRKDLWNRIYNLASCTSDEQTQAYCFSALRILGRDQKLLDILILENDWLGLIKKCCGLDDPDFQFTDKNKFVAVEAEKSLCNLVRNSQKVAKKCCENDILYNIIDRMKLYKNCSFPAEIKFFDVKLVFIITALCPASRKTLRDEKNAVFYHVDVLHHILDSSRTYNANDIISLNDESVNLSCELLKSLFNLTVHVKIDENDMNMYKDLMKLLREYLLISTDPKEKSNILHNDVINLLTNMPNQCYSKLIPSMEDRNEKVLEYRGHNVECLKQILEILKKKLINDGSVTQQHEILSPILTVMYKGACAESIIRKYLRSEILPPLKDVHSRPEDGSTLRNYLCRLLTSPMTCLRDIVAEFLFVLCKMNVRRMIKYTGYGNAAGLFAQRGLLGCQQDEEASKFSSDSEDSETEEYAEHKHEINPVLGCYEPPRSDAMADMTDEQKEYEAMKLVQLMDNLTKSGTIKPCRVGKDGKPEPIEHVLQLREHLKNQKYSQEDSDSD